MILEVWFSGSPLPSSQKACWDNLNFEAPALSTRSAAGLLCFGIRTHKGRKLRRSSFASDVVIANRFGTPPPKHARCRGFCRPDPGSHAQAPFVRQLAGKSQDAPNSTTPKHQHDQENRLAKQNPALRIPTPRSALVPRLCNAPPLGSGRLRGATSNVTRGRAIRGVGPRGARGSRRKSKGESEIDRKDLGAARRDRRRKARAPICTLFTKRQIHYP